MVVIGIVILAVGIALIAAGAFGALQSTTIITTFNEIHSDQYVSSELVLNSTSAVVVSSAAATGGLIYAQDLDLVNSTNISQYAIPYNSSVVSDTLTYKSLTGNYYYVAFSTSVPSTKIVATAIHSGASRFGALIIGGFVFVIAGIVVAVIGALRKRKPKKDDTYHHADELQASSNPRDPNFSSR
jgi:hypothetical protein